MTLISKWHQLNPLFSSRSAIEYPFQLTNFMTSKVLTLDCALKILYFKSAFVVDLLILLGFFLLMKSKLSFSLFVLLRCLMLFQLQSSKHNIISGVLQFGAVRVARSGISQESEYVFYTDVRWHYGSHRYCLWITNHRILCSPLFEASTNINTYPSDAS